MNWNCPFCNHDQAGEPEAHEIRLRDSAKGGSRTAILHIMHCRNNGCLESTYRIGLAKNELWPNGEFRRIGDIIKLWNLIPQSSAKVLPDYIPIALRSDYEEACLIRDQSPKASATLSRRCLQGMIRDFCGVSGRTLHAEIDQLKKMEEDGRAPRGVAFETIDAMYHVKNIGNIGAHMEKEINTIIDVDANEAQNLIDLLEILFKDWYIERHNRNLRLQDLKMVASLKGDQKKLPSP